MAEHLYKAGPKSSNSRLDAIKGGLTHGAKKGLKYVVGGAVFYFAVSLALGGRDRVKHDLEVLKVRRQDVCKRCLLVLAILSPEARCHGTASSMPAFSDITSRVSRSTLAKKHLGRVMRKLSDVDGA